MTEAEIDRRCVAIERELDAMGIPPRSTQPRKRWPFAILAALTLSGCRYEIDHISLKSRPPAKPVAKRIATKAAPAPVVLAPVSVVAPTSALADELEARLSVELANRGFTISDTGTTRIMGAVLENPPSVTWTIIDPAGGKVGSIRQENSNGNVQESSIVIASSAAVSIAKLLPAPTLEARP